MWIDDVIAAYGEPDIRIDVPVSRYGDDGPTERRGWVWFVKSVNHHVTIDQHKRNSEWVVTLGAHRSDMPEVRMTMRTEPTDPDVRKMMDLIGFLSSATS